MFQDLSQNDILAAINSLLQKKLEETQYRLWYKGNLLPPKDVIREAYLIKGVRNPNPGFDTDQAQERLLNLGFPIVEFTKASDQTIFSKKDVVSFSRLASRPSYDKNNLVDKNIGEYLHAIPWGKTQTWARALEKRGWIVKGHRQWNIQDRSHGQSFKKYTWYRVFPADRKNDLIFFTVGISLRGQLVYKIDIFRDHEDFPKDLIEYFDDRAHQIESTRRIDAEGLKDLTWAELVDTTHDFFSAHLKNYQSITNELWPEERLMRLTWNDNNWEFPSGHKWDVRYQGTMEAYEKQYGFGHEEWLFNSRYRVNGFQYGFIQGINQLPSEQETIDRLLLFTINTFTKDRYLVARLNEVEIIEGYEPEQRLIRPVITRHLGRMVEELADAGADVAHFRRSGFVANVKFEWNKAEIFNGPVLFNQIKGGRYDRFQAYKIDRPLNATINSSTPTDIKLSFEAGKANNSPSYEKSTRANKTTVERRHSSITNDLYDYLIKYKGFREGEVSCEKTRVGGQIVDVAINVDKVFTLFEIKTESVALRNIRLALGQLFEYALLDRSTRLEKLVIVGPAELNFRETQYLGSLMALVRIPLEYWSYSFQETALENKFRTYPGLKQ